MNAISIFFIFIFTMDIVMVTMVISIVASKCSDYHLINFPFPLLLSLLGSILMLFLIGTT